MRLSKQSSSRQATPVIASSGDEVKYEVNGHTVTVIDPVNEFIDLGEARLEYEDHVSRLLAVSQRRLSELEDRKKELEELISRERKWFDGFNELLKK